MSIRIDVYPRTDVLPLVDQTRARAQELFQQLLVENEIESRIEIKAFYPLDNETEIDEEPKSRFVSKDAKWQPDKNVAFAYYINDQWDSNSLTKFLSTSDAQQEYKSEMVDYGLLLPQQLDAILAQHHFRQEERDSVNGPAVSSTGYGFVAAALAEATEGLMFTDTGSGICHDRESAKDFLEWWGDEQFSFYGKELFINPRMF